MPDGIHSLWLDGFFLSMKSVSADQYTRIRPRCLQYVIKARTHSRYLTSVGGIVGNANFLDVVGHPGAGLLGIIVSVYNLGCFSGCIMTFILGEYFGRRRCMWVAMGWIIVSCFPDCSAEFLLKSAKHRPGRRYNVPLILLRI